MISITTDAHGFRRASVPKGLEPLAWFLEQDVGQSKDDAGFWLDRVTEVKTSGEAWSGTGNAHEVTISTSSVTIENMFTEDGRCEIDIDEFVVALREWCGET